MVRTVVPDKLTGVTAAQAITAALLARERTGEGQHVRLAMLDAMVSFLWPEGMMDYTFIGDDTGKRPGRGSPLRDLVFDTADGFITVATVSDAEWAGFARAIGRRELIEDPRFKTATARVINWDERLELMGDAVRNCDSATWVSRLDAEQVPCAPILGRRDLLTDPQIAANELIVESQHPEVGRMRQTRPAARFGRTPSEIRHPAPTLGQHTDEVLAELGMEDSKISALRESGAVA